MDEPQQPVLSDAGDALRPWQFGLRTLLAAPVGVALFMWFFLAWYPFSRTTLPCLGFALAMVFAWRMVRPKSLSVAEALVTAFLVYALAAMGFAGVAHVPNRSHMVGCANRLREIAMALQNYHDRYGCFPPAYLADADGRPMHSWRVLILPYLGRQDLYAKYRFDEPWDGPNNSQLAAAVVDQFHCPEQDAASGQTSYLAVVGPTTPWPGATSAKLSDFYSHGTTNTALVVEVADSGIHWMEPRDLDVAAMPMTVNSKKGMGISSRHDGPGWRRNPLGAYLATADGRVEFLSTDTPESDLRALLVPPPAKK